MADDIAPDQTTRPSALADDDARMRCFKAWFRADAQHSSKWRKEAYEDFAFVAGEQYTREETDQLREQGRIPITFNRTLGIVKAVAGTEINGRHEIKFVPRGNEDTQVNDLLTGASKWLADGCDAEDEESEAFQDALVCGMGWNEARMSYEEDPEGKYLQDCVDPLQMWWDRKARKKNLADATRVWRVVKMARQDAKEKFPDVDEGILDATWTTGYEYGDEPKSYEEKVKRFENTGEYTDDELRIVQLQWYEKETYYKVADPTSGKMVDLDAGQHKRLMARAKKLGVPEPRSAKLTRRVYKQAWLGQELLEPVEDAPFKDRFSWACITGEPDHNGGTWFGFVRVARDPQRWSNLWLLQTQYILNSSAKGGIMAETSAFKDQRQAEESWAKQDRITWVSDRALSGEHKKIDFKPVAQFPSGYFQMMEFAVMSIPQVTGINYEFMGQKDVNQPGVLENMRKMAAMTILATMFDSLRRFRKIIGRLRLFVIQNFISDGRLIRITNQPQAVPLMKEKTAGEYDVVVDDAPTSPNQKERNWAIIADLLPAFKDQLAANPHVLMEVLKYSPLPADLVVQIEQAMAKPNPEQEEAKAIAKATAVAKLNQLQSTADLNQSKSGASEATAMYDIAMAEHLLKKNDNEAGLGELATAAHKAAQIETERAKAEKLRAEVPKTHAETAGEIAGIHKTHAEAVSKHADAHATRRETDTPKTNGKASAASAPVRDEVLHAHLAALSQHAASQTAAMNALVQHATTAKRRIPHRDASGRITHVDEVSAQ